MRRLQGSGPARGRADGEPARRGPRPVAISSACIDDKGYLLRGGGARAEGDRRADLVFHIKEGKKVQVAKIEFSAQPPRLLRRKLREAMKTMEDRWWRGADFTGRVRGGQEADRPAPGQEGTSTRGSSDVQQTFGEGQVEALVDHPGEEGEPYTVGTIAVDHGKILPDSRVKGAVRLCTSTCRSTPSRSTSRSRPLLALPGRGLHLRRRGSEEDSARGAVIDVDFASRSAIRRTSAASRHRNTRTHRGRDPPGAACRARGCLQALEGDPQPARGVSARLLRGHQARQRARRIARRRTSIWSST